MKEGIVPKETSQPPEEQMDHHQDMKKKEMIERDMSMKIIEGIMKEKVNKIVPLGIGENLKEEIRVVEVREIFKVTVPFLNRLL
jgi:hypothetical protein